MLELPHCAPLVMNPRSGKRWTGYKGRKCLSVELDISVLNMLKRGICIYTLRATALSNPVTSSSSFSAPIHSLLPCSRRLTLLYFLFPSLSSGRSLVIPPSFLSKLRCHSQSKQQPANHLHGLQPLRPIGEIQRPIFLDLYSGE